MSEPYVPGDPESPLQTGEVFEHMEKESDGTQAGNDVTEVFKVDLENAPNLIKNVEKVLEEDL